MQKSIEKLSSSNPTAYIFFIQQITKYLKQRNTQYKHINTIAAELQNYRLPSVWLKNILFFQNEALAVLYKTIHIHAEKVEKENSIPLSYDFYELIFGYYNAVLNFTLRMPAYIEQAIYDEKTPSSIDLTLITRFEEIYYDFFAEKLLKFGKKNKKLRPLIIQALLFKVPTEVSDEKYREYEQMFREKRLNREENIAELKYLNDYIDFLIKQTKEQYKKNN